MKELKWALVNLGAALLFALLTVTFKVSPWGAVPNLLGAAFFVGMHVGGQSDN